MENLLESLNAHGFAFNRDFVLKTCLTLLNQGSRYEVDKFRRDGVREQIESEWEKITEALCLVLDFVRGKTFIQCHKALPSYLVLIPLVYVCYHFRNEWIRARGLDSYLLRCSLAGAFGGNPDRLLDGLVGKITEIKGFDLDELFGVIRGQGRSLELTEDRFWQMGYGSDTIHLLFNLWYQAFDYNPAYENNLPQVDHIFPQSALQRIKTVNKNTGRRDLQKYKAPERNQLANCMLLSRQENGAGGKSDSLPSEWFAGKSDHYLEMHLIPKDHTLWQLDRYEEFIEARKALIRQKFASIIVLSASQIATVS